MNLLPDDIANNESEWIECLVDDELNATQLPRMYQYLDENSEAWKRCAIAMLDERALRKGVLHAFAPEGVEFVTPYAKPQVPTKRLDFDGKLSSKRNWLSLVLVAGGAMLVGALGYRLTTLSQTEQAESLVASIEFPVSDRDSFTPLDQESGRTQVSFQEAFRPNTLVEVENSPTRAVYYLDHQVPKFLLEAMVIAGHQLSIGQEMISIDGPDGQALEVPINKLEIEKYTATSL